jgi:CxxC motif-containing protein (DUF1111 family)
MPANAAARLNLWRVISMRHFFSVALVVFGGVFISTVGLRLLTWPATRHTQVDAAMAELGRELFEHEWAPGDPLASCGDGLGPVFNATSCVACHNQAGPGGAGPVEFNVTTFTVRPMREGEQPREGVVHTMATDKELQETLAHVNPSLPPQSQPALKDLLPVPGCNVRVINFPSGVHISQRNTPALFGAKLIDEIPEREIIANERKQRLAAGLATPDVEDVPVGRALVLADGRVGRFGWKAQTASLLDFVQAACANELGLGNPGQAQPRPLGKPGYLPPGLDLSDQQCAQLTEFIASLPQPVERLPENSKKRERAIEGKKLFSSIGCANCHLPDVGDVKGLYSDLLLHRMGQDLEGGGSYDDPPLPAKQFEPGTAPAPGEWRTPPLWGVASSAPYMHDGRASTLQQAIKLHDGQAQRAKHRFESLDAEDQDRLIAFLETLQAPEVGGTR